MVVNHLVLIIFNTLVCYFVENFVRAVIELCNRCLNDQDRIEVIIKKKDSRSTWNERKIKLRPDKSKVIEFRKGCKREING